jgi:hypothetical protein
MYVASWRKKRVTSEAQLNNYISRQNGSTFKFRILGVTTLRKFQPMVNKN